VRRESGQSHDSKRVILGASARPRSGLPNSKRSSANAGSFPGPSRMPSYATEVGGERVGRYTRADRTPSRVPQQAQLLHDLHSSRERTCRTTSFPGQQVDRGRPQTGTPLANVNAHPAGFFLSVRRSRPPN